jgi:hypothetical protein
MVHRVVWYKLTDVSEVLAASLIRAMLPSSPHGFTSQKTNIDMFIVVNIIALMKEATSTSETSVSLY